MCCPFSTKFAAMMTTYLRISRMILVAIVFQMAYGGVLRPPTENELIKLMLLWGLCNVILEM
jgi:hypothetical protein